MAGGGADDEAIGDRVTSTDVTPTTASSSTSSADTIRPSRARSCSGAAAPTDIAGTRRRRL